MIGEGDEKPSFAELMGDAKPLREAAARIEPARREGSIRRGNAHKQARSAARFRWPDADEPRLAAAEGVSDARLLALGRGEPAPAERIDLHGVRRDGAARLLRDRLASARARRLRCVVVIHGQGQGSGSGESVLREGLPGWLSKGECASHVLAFAPAPARHGGAGATLVLLRRPGKAGAASSGV